MKLSNALRARVVELLRCAADVGMRGKSCPLSKAEDWLDAPKRIGAAADLAILALNADYDDSLGMWQSYAFDCLEAALRVEEKSWP